MLPHTPGDPRFPLPGRPLLIFVISARGILYGPGKPIGSSGVVETAYWMSSYMRSTLCFLHGGPQRGCAIFSSSHEDVGLHSWSYWLACAHYQLGTCPKSPIVHFRGSGTPTCHVLFFCQPVKALTSAHFRLHRHLSLSLPLSLLPRDRSRSWLKILPSSPIRQNSKRSSFQTSPSRSFWMRFRTCPLAVVVCWKNSEKKFLEPIASSATDGGLLSTCPS